jgi:hypothetical protein
MGRTNWPVSAVRGDAVVSGGVELDIQSRERLAWLILIGAFAIFVVLAITTPLAVRWYLWRATVAQRATIEVNSGTIPVVQSEGAAPIAVAEGSARDDIQEGAKIRTDSSSQAFLTLFDHSTVVVFPGTELRLRRMRTPRFSFSDHPLEIVLEVTQGRVRVGVAPEVDRPARTLVITPHGRATLKEGSYAVEVTKDETQFAVRTGEALVQATGGVKGILLNQSERAVLYADRSPEGPLPAARNLVSNSDFLNDAALAKPIGEGTLAEGWRVYNDQGGDGGNVDGTATVIPAGDRNAVRFYRTNSLNNHGETGIIQQVNKDVSDYLSIKLRLDIKLVYQSLSGGGDQSSEYPVIVRINYKDVYGNDNHWTHGFYYQNVDRKPTQNGQRIPRNVWYSFEEPNLKEKLVNPRTITSIQVYASGWDYESLVSEIGIIAE